MTVILQITFEEQADNFISVSAKIQKGKYACSKKELHSALRLAGVIEGLLDSCCTPEENKSSGTHQKDTTDSDKANRRYSK